MDSLTGIGFRPLDEEIIDLLKKKRLDRGFSVETIKEIDFYSFDPWDLAGLSEFQSMQDVCYFFSKPKYRGAKRKRSGQQQHRKTKSGTWKKTGSDSEMKRKNSTEVIGNKDYLVFIHNDATSEKVNTKWLMHEIAIADDPLYKENFVVCRLERKTCDKKLGVSTTDKHQSSQDFASSSSINVVEDMSLESAQPPDRHLVSKTTQIVENINLKNHLQPKNTSTGLQLVPHDVLESLRLPDEQWALEQESSYSNGPSFGGDLLNSQFDSGQAIAFSESQQLPNHLISCSRNHVAENTSTGLQLVLHPVLESWRSPDEQRATYSIDQESSYSNGPSFGGDLLNSQFDSGQVIAFSESQQLPNHLTSCSRNHVAENTSTGLQLVPHPVLESLRESKDN
ncbi:NAC domain-containing protein 7-like [Citrus clementina]|uniref:NAC domain-containing protein 7-like n=1 Tax=Citrus clementina TaxID=85681 RepID=UPI000CED0641|nr:NAC domain-containing protein 7-like [Citrus x clementina]